MAWASPDISPVIYCGARYAAICGTFSDLARCDVLTVRLLRSSCESTTAHNASGAS